MLCHCSDGWDRTAQCCALAQMLLDPHFRTIAGLRDVISKDFQYFGHKFRSRGGTGDREKEWSPIFIQVRSMLRRIVSYCVMLEANAHNTRSSNTKPDPAIPTPSPPLCKVSGRCISAMASSADRVRIHGCTAATAHASVHISSHSRFHIRQLT